MASRKRQSVVGYAGVYFVEALRAAGHGTEKIYYIRYRKQGKLIEEKVGGQYRDNMTAAKAASIRGLRIEGKDASNDEKRAAARAARQAEESRYSFNRIWALFAEAKSANRTIKDDRIRYSLHIAPALGKKSIPELTGKGRKIPADSQACPDADQTPAEFCLAQGLCGGDSRHIAYFHADG